MSGEEAGEKTHEFELLLTLLECQVARDDGVLPREADDFGAVQIVREASIEVAGELREARERVMSAKDQSGRAASTDLIEELDQELDLYTSRNDQHSGTLENQ